MKVGFTCSTFDLFHAGHVIMLKEAKTQCDYLIVGLHEDATYRPNKLKPVLSIKDRYEILKSLTQVDEIIAYKSEEDLLNILTTRRINVRILGDDYRDNHQRITGASLNIPIVYHDRSAGWSATKFKNLIKDSL